MVAVANSSDSLRTALHYNENKVKQKKTSLIHAKGFAKDSEKLGFTDKINHLQKLASLNKRTQVNSVHISLNFDPSEKPDKETLPKVADAYMQKIGFGGQPYLVYQHTDAGNPHIHLLTTNIQAKSRRIELHNIGRNQSEQARKAIEEEFNLVRADDRKQRQAFELKPVNAQKVVYGRSETKRAITNVLAAVVDKYHYASLTELNTLLRQYNVMADRGGKQSRIHQNNDLVYRVLDEQGEKVGVPG